MTRARYERKSDLYASYLIDKEWILIESLLPPSVKGRDRPRKVRLTEVVNGLLYMATTGCQWRQKIKGRMEPRNRLDPYRRHPHPNNKNRKATIYRGLFMSHTLI